MKHTNEIAIQILKEEYGDYPQNAWHYDREYKMIVKALKMQHTKIMNLIEWKT
jgi:hypothetical protein